MDGRQDNRPRVWLLLNHPLTTPQEEELQTVFGCGPIHELPEELREAWAQVPPDLEDLRGYAGPFIRWMAEQSREGDVLVVQGDFGLTFLVVRWALEKGRLPLYSTTERDYSGRAGEDGSVLNLHRFKHERFRRYVQ